MGSAHSTSGDAVSSNGRPFRRCRCHEKNFSDGEGGKYLVWKDDANPAFYLDAYQKIRNVQMADERQFVEGVKKLGDSTLPKSYASLMDVADLQDTWEEIVRLNRRLMWKDACMSVLLFLCRKHLSCDCDAAAKATEKRLSAEHVRRRIVMRRLLITHVDCLWVATKYAFDRLEAELAERPFSFRHDSETHNLAMCRADMYVMNGECMRILDAYSQRCRGVPPTLRVPERK